MTGEAQDGHQAPAVRPRYGRLTAFTAAVLITFVALLGGVGVLPSGGNPSYASTAGDTATLASAGERGRPQADTDARPGHGHADRTSGAPDPTPHAGPGRGGRRGGGPLRQRRGQAGGVLHQRSSGCGW